jgi:hypothetical protein
MHRKLKVLGVTLFALFALSAVAASSAFAAEGVFTAGKPEATLTGSQIGAGKLTVGSTGARTVECSTVHLDSTTTISNSTTSTIEFGAQYSNCVTSPGGGPATVSSTGCDIHVTLSEKLTTSTGKASGSLAGTSCDLSIVANSTAGSKICEYTIPNQAASGFASWASAASTPSDDLIFSLGSTGLSSVKVLFGSLAACGAAAGNSATGKLDGEFTITAEVLSTPTSLTIS